MGRDRVGECWQSRRLAGGACRNAHSAAAPTLTNKTCGPTHQVSFTKLPVHPVHPAPQPLPTFHAASPLSLSPLRKRLRASWLIMVGSALTAALALPGGRAWGSRVAQTADPASARQDAAWWQDGTAIKCCTTHSRMHAYPWTQFKHRTALCLPATHTVLTILSLLLLALPLHRRQQLQLVALSLQRQLGHVQLQVGAGEEQAGGPLQWEGHHHKHCRQAESVSPTSLSVPAPSAHLLSPPLAQQKRRPRQSRSAAAPALQRCAWRPRGRRPRPARRRARPAPATAWSQRPPRPEGDRGWGWSG